MGTGWPKYYRLYLYSLLHKVGAFIHYGDCLFFVVVVVVVVDMELLSYRLRKKIQVGCGGASD